MGIAIINPGSGNITSVCDALSRLGKGFVVVESPEQVTCSDQLILPGQGRFGPVSAFLKQQGWSSFLRDWMAQDRPFLGICVGMQVLFEASEEDPQESGLGLFPGKVEALRQVVSPMMGWANVSWSMSDWPKGAAYFVNSFVVRDCPDESARTDYGGFFCSAVARGRVRAFQFHPEKSGSFGEEVLLKCLDS